MGSNNRIIDLTSDEEANCKETRESATNGCKDIEADHGVPGHGYKASLNVYESADEVCKVSKGASEDPADVCEASKRSSGDKARCVGQLRKGRIGTFVGGGVRLTQSSRDHHDNYKLSFDDILQTTGLQECILTSYVADQDWLLPKIAKVPKVVLCLGDGERTPKATYVERHGFTVIRSPFPKFPCYGVMHCKLMLLLYPGFLRLVVSSGNLVPFDYDRVQNIVFIQDLPKIQGEQDLGALPFTAELLQLLRTLGFRMGEESDLSISKLCRFDWTQVKVQLVYSTPGMFNAPHQNGLCMLAEKAGGYCVQAGDFAIECQGSSLGALEAEWLMDFISCASGTLPPEQPTQTGKKSSRCDAELTMHGLQQRIKIVFPTMSYALRNLEEFGTVFCQSKQWASERCPKRLFHRCESRHGVGQALHTKIIMARDYYYVGSANFTASAWGKFVKGKTALMVANYELGVLMPAEPPSPSFFPCGQFPCPYQRPPKPYDLDSDAPWMQDVLQSYS